MIDFINSLGSSDMASLELCLTAYRENAFKEEVEDMGFNVNSGYVYLYLTNGICIASCFGQDVTYIRSNFETGEEDFYDEYYNCLHEIKEDEKDI
jgi:hypothetical protein